VAVELSYYDIERMFKRVWAIEREDCFSAQSKCGFAP